jgi:hypothetical protein
VPAPARLAALGELEKAAQTKQLTAAVAKLAREPALATAAARVARAWSAASTQGASTPEELIEALDSGGGRIIASGKTADVPKPVSLGLLQLGGTKLTLDRLDRFRGPERHGTYEAETDRAEIRVAKGEDATCAELRFSAEPAVRWREELVRLDYLAVSSAGVDDDFEIDHKKHHDFAIVGSVFYVRLGSARVLFGESESGAVRRLLVAQVRDIFYPEPQ